MASEGLSWPQPHTMAISGCGLAARHSAPGGRSAWVWTEKRLPRRPPDAELAAAGFGGSQWVEGPQGARNLLLLLHGLGDSPVPFARLAATMALPETSALALRAPCSLPAGLDGSMWHESFDAEGEVLLPSADLLAEPRRSLRALLATLERFGWPARRVFLLGYMQGGVVALDLAVHASESRLGGVVSVCGHLPPDLLPSPTAMGVQTPVLVIAGTRDDHAPVAVARHSFDALRNLMGHDVPAKLTEIEGRAIGSQREMRPLMEFFAANLELHTAALEDDPSIIRVH